MKYNDWTMSVADKILKQGLKTADAILDDAGSAELDYSSLEKLHYCVDLIEKSRHLLAENEEEMGGLSPAAMAR